MRLMAKHSICAYRCSVRTAARYLLFPIALLCVLLAACADQIPDSLDSSVIVEPRADPDRPPDDLLLHLNSYRKVQFMADRMQDLIAAERIWCDLQPVVAELRALLDDHDPDEVWRTLLVPADGDDLRAIELIAEATADARGIAIHELPAAYLVSRTSLRQHACLTEEVWDDPNDDDDWTVGRPASRLAYLIGQDVQEYGAREQRWLSATLVLGWYGEIPGADEMAPGADGIGEIVLVSQPQMPDFYAATVAHEMVHVLQDQWTGWRLHDWYREAETTDQLQALRWVVEGDATLNELAYDEPPLAGLLADIEWGSEEHAEVDLWLRAYHSLTPQDSDAIYAAYDEGSQVMAALREAEGQAAIDALLLNPPSSVEQLMHADKLAAEEQPSALTDLPDLQRALFASAHWDEPIVDRMGEQWLRSLIATATGRPDIAEDAATGWGGDQMTLWRTHDGEIEVVTWQVVFDNPAEHEQGVSGLRRWFYSHSHNEADRVAGDLLHWNGPTGTASLISQSANVWLVASNNKQIADYVTSSIRNRTWTEYWASP